jgi:hypothetical protein
VLGKRKRKRHNFLSIAIGYGGYQKRFFKNIKKARVEAGFSIF